MASGKTHSRVAVLAGVVGVVATMVWLPEAPLEKVAVGFALGWAVTPDADVDHATVEELWWDRIPLVGRAVGTVYQMVWLPYARLIPHRDALSHWPLVGTAGRIAYMAAWLAAISLIAGRWIVDWRVIWNWIWPWGYAAWAVQDIGHWAFDYAPGLKRL